MDWAEADVKPDVLASNLQTAATEQLFNLTVERLSEWLDLDYPWSGVLLPRLVNQYSEIFDTLPSVVERLREDILQRSALNLKYFTFPDLVINMYAIENRLFLVGCLNFGTRVEVQANK